MRSNPAESKESNDAMRFVYSKEPKITVLLRTSVEAVVSENGMSRSVQVTKPLRLRFSVASVPVPSLIPTGDPGQFIRSKRNQKCGAACYDDQFNEWKRHGFVAENDRERLWRDLLKQPGFYGDGKSLATADDIDKLNLRQRGNPKIDQPKSVKSVLDITHLQVAKPKPESAAQHAG